MKLIVGLGNPGKKYEHTRHNAGFMALDALREKLSSPAWELSKKFNGYVSEHGAGQKKAILLKPATYMNHSGQAVELAAHFYKIPMSDIVIVHDDKDIPLGTVKVQAERGDAGHNGVRSVVQHLGGNEFTRVRIGVAPEKPGAIKDTAQFVLKKFSLFERGRARDAVAKAVSHLQELMV